jgi:heptosyltransferase III
MAALYPDHVKPPATILVICTRRLGDVLLTTPIVRSLKTRWPQAEIDMLVFEGTECVLEHNPDIRRVLTVAHRTGLAQRWRDARAIWRKYDLACAAMSSDRAGFYAWFAGRKRIGLLLPAGKSWFKRLMFNRYALENNAQQHVVQTGLALLPLVGVAPRAEVVAPGLGSDPARHAELAARLAPLRDKPYAVLHLYPMYAYKMWHSEGWLALIDWLRAQGHGVVLTGGSAPDEVAYAADIAQRAGADVLNLVGSLSLGATAQVIRAARLFVGPDTSASHIAAATGTPTVALFGPSNPVRWGPWPQGWQAATSPWKLTGSGRHGNVYLVQGAGDCVPCKLEGCEAHLRSWSDCLLMLDANRVIDAACELLGWPVNRQHRIPIVSQSLPRPARRQPLAAAPTGPDPAEPAGAGRRA